MLLEILATVIALGHLHAPLRLDKRQNLIFDTHGHREAVISRYNFYVWIVLPVLTVRGVLILSKSPRSSDLGRWGVSRHPKCVSLSRTSMRHSTCSVCRKITEPTTRSMAILFLLPVGVLTWCWHFGYAHQTRTRFSYTLAPRLRATSR